MRPSTLANGFCFGEGPRWFEGLLWFSDVLGEAVHTVDLNGSMTTLPLPGRAPSGLGFRPDGSLLIVSSGDRQILRYDGDSVVTVADLADLVPASLGDMVIDEAGRAYVGSQARDGGVIVRIDLDDAVDVVAEDLSLPNGMVVTADGGTLVVAESAGRRLTAFTIAADGSLSDRRVFADDLDGPPDGIAIDADGGVWVAMTLAQRFARVVDGGTVTDRVDVAGRTAVACTLGGPQNRVLFLVSSTLPCATARDVEHLAGSTLSRIDTVVVDVPGTGPIADH